MMKKPFPALLGALAFTAAFDASAYTYDWNVNGTPSIDPMTNQGSTLGLGPGGQGFHYNHRILGLTAGDEWHVTGADHAMFDHHLSHGGTFGVGPGTDGAYDPNWATTGGGSGSYGVGGQSWCMGGVCAGDPEPSFAHTSTGQTVLFQLSSPQTVSIKLSGDSTLAPAGLGQGKYGMNAHHTGSGGLNTGLNPAFTLYSGMSTTGTWAQNHTMEVDSNPNWTNLTYLYHDDNTVFSEPDEFGIRTPLGSREADKTLEHTFANLPAGYYTLYLGSNIDNPVIGTAGAKNFYLQIQTSAVPVPAAVWLFGSALAGLGLAGRRRSEGAPQA